MDKTKEQLAVVILNWNGLDMMRRFLPGVWEHSRNEAAVYVADNGSTDGSTDWLRREMPDVRLIEFSENYGFAEGYNQALSQIEATYYLLLNSDVEVHAGWLTPLLSYMNTHPQVAACQPKLLSQISPRYFEYAGAAGGFVDKLGYPFCRGRLFATVEPDYGQYDHVHPVFWATGAALMVRADVFHRVGGLDGRFFAHMEEIDFCWRLRSRGYGIVCIPDSVAYHVGGGTLPKESPRKVFLNFRNNLLMLYKNLPESELHSVLRRRFWLDALASLQFLLKGEWSCFRAVWHARAEYARLRPAFAADRKRNMALACPSEGARRAPYSILWYYYLKQRKTFRDLPEFALLVFTFISKCLAYFI